MDGKAALKTPALRLVSIPEQHYSDYRYNAIFKAYKWDPQVGDHNTVARHVVLLDRALANELGQLAEQLAAETVGMEQALVKNNAPAKKLGFSRETLRALKRTADYEPDLHVRLMRFDFHPTVDGWAISEVNSDVPGGFAEASALPLLARPYFAGHVPGENAAAHLVEAFARKLPDKGTIALVHCTAYADDRQVMQCLGDAFVGNGFRVVYAAPDHIQWVERHALCILEGDEGPIDGVVRFFPLEWLANLPRASRWQGFYDSLTPSCNHPVAMFAQSKRLPLVWDALGVNHDAWGALLPDTRDPKQVRSEKGWLYKPALGRVGEGISIQEAISAKELKQIERAARRSPGDWLAQRRFESLPLQTDEGEIFHLCIGVFTIEGRAAGFYGRISPYPRIDANAKDIPILVGQEETNHVR